MKTAYFSALDTVHFRNEIPTSVRDRRMVGATGAVMLQMLLADVTPVLSQTQAFDGAVIVNTLARFDDKGATLVKMARSGRLRVPVLDGPLLCPDPSDGERFTLLNAFVSALRRTDFVFAAWPEFTGAPDLRATIAEQLDRRPEQVEQIADGSLRDKLCGLVELDRALRTAPRSPLARFSAGPGLCSRTLAGIQQARRVQPASTAFLTRLEARVRTADDADLYDRRSAWYALFQEYEEVFGAEAGSAVAIARGVVDAVYNQLVAVSLGADGIEMEIPDFETAEIVARSGIECRLGARAIQLVSEPSFNAWLTWSRLTDTMTKMEHLTLPQSRFRYLVGRYREHDVARRAERISGGQVWAHIAAAPTNVAGAMTGGVVGMVLGGDTGALLGGMIGSLSGVYANYILDRRKTRELSRAENRARREFDGRFAPVLSGGSLAYRVDHDA